jgi:GlcNAc-P-P-Und epimerase
MRVLLTGGSGFIGTAIVDALLTRGAVVLNIDTKKPHKATHLSLWSECDILDTSHLNRAFQSFAPTHVVHLAARTDVLGTTLEDYETNTKGTSNVLLAIKGTDSVARALITSTQFVHQYHGNPSHDEDYAPHTVYGESKVITEQLTRAANLACVWTIVRPTNVWGPWHPRYPIEFWRVLGRGMYFHPGRAKVLRSYGYVGNVVAQMVCILISEPSLVNRRVFYVGDRAINLYDWVNGFALAQTGKPVKVVPAWLVGALAVAGDVLSKIGIKFPITSSRYKSMTSSNDVSMEAIHALCGEPPFSLQAGIDESVNWLRDRYPDLVRR